MTGEGRPHGARAGPSGGRLPWSRLPFWAAGLLLAGILAAVPVLLERAGVEAGYRQVMLVAQVTGAPGEATLPEQAPAWRERGARALLFPVERLEDPEATQAAAASGLGIFLFWQAPPHPHEFSRALAVAQNARLDVALVGGVDGSGGGSRATRSTAAGALEELAGMDGPLIALVELEGSSLWPELARQAPERAVVAHWVPPEEWEGYQGPGAGEARLARYVRAVRERQARVLVVPLHPGDQQSLDFLGALARRIQSLGYSLGPVPSVPPFGAGAAARALMGAGVGSALWLLGWVWRRARAKGEPSGDASGPLIGLVLAVGVGGLLALLPPTVLPLVGGSLAGRALVAWLAAVAFPLGAVLSLRGPSGLGQKAAWGPLWGLFQASLISVAGGVLVAGLLSSREALFRLELFRGVKAMHLLPPLLATLALVPQPARRWLASLGPLGRGNGVPGRRRWLGVGLALAGVVALGALLVYYVGRTGNELVPVPQWERVLRDRIEGFLGTRPRFKELLGHGALVAGLMVLARQGRPPSGRGPGPAGGGQAFAELLGGVLLVVGSVGQLSVVNTFAHLHQPLVVILQRVGYGLIGGSVVGLVGGVGLRWGLGWWERGAASQASRRR